MTSAIIEFGKKKVPEAFNFLNAAGYNLIKSGSKDDSSFEFIFLNENVKKKISIGVLNYEDVKRFFLMISITNEPYKTVDDYISFSEYLKKNGISVPNKLESQNRTTESIEKYIKEYANL